MSSVRELAARLELPPPARGEFLDQVAGDLEGLYEELCARGVGREEAWRMAADMLLPDEHTLRALSALHRPLWVRWKERLTSAGGAADAALLFMLTGVMMLLTLAALANGGVLAPLTWSLAPVVVVGGVESALIAWQVFTVVVHGETRAQALRAGARRIAGVAILAVVIAVLAAAAGLIGATTDAAVQAQSSSPLLLWVTTATAQLSLGFVIALEGALAWLLLGRRAARIEHDAARTVARIRGFHFPAAR